MKFAPIRIIGDSQRLTPQVMRELLTYNSGDRASVLALSGDEYFNRSAKRSRKWIADAWNKKHAGKHWKIKPSILFRISACWSSSMVDTSTPPQVVGAGGGHVQAADDVHGGGLA